MAFRTIARRWPAASLEVRALLRSGQQQQQTRAYAEEYTGKALNEREKAAENRYIRQLEEQRKLKKAAGGAHGEIPVTPTGELPQTKGFFSTGVVAAGLAAVVGGWWLLSGRKSEEEGST